MGDSIGMQCLTASGEYEQFSGKNGVLNHEQARIFICQNWLHQMNLINNYLNETFSIGLLTDETLDYDAGAGVSNDFGNDQSGMWGVDEGPNAKNTVIAFKAICEDIIPENHPELGYSCRGGYVTNDGEELSHSDCREKWDRKNIKKGKKRCRREIKNRAGNKGKWL